MKEQNITAVRKNRFLQRVRFLWSQRKVRIVVAVLVGLLIAWFALGYYLHVQVKNSRAKVEQARIEASRRQESARRQASYQQALERYQQGSRQQPQRYGQ